MSSSIETKKSKKVHDADFLYIKMDGVQIIIAMKKYHSQHKKQFKLNLMEANKLFESLKETLGK